MPIDVEKVVTNLSKNTGVSRAQAIEWLRQANNRDDPTLRDVVGRKDVDEYVAKQSGVLGSMLPQAAISFAEPAVRYGTGAASTLLNLAGLEDAAKAAEEPYNFIEHLHQQYPEADISSILGEFAGSALPFGAAEKLGSMVAGPALETLLGVRGLSSAVRAGDEIGTGALAEGIGKMGAVNRLRPVVGGAIGGAALEATQKEGDPLTGALQFGAFGLAHSLISMSYEKPLGEALGNPKVAAGAAEWARLRHRTVDEAVVELKTVAGLDQALKGLGAKVNIDPLDVMSGQDAEALKAATTVNVAPPKAPSDNTVYTKATLAAANEERDNLLQKVAKEKIQKVEPKGPTIVPPSDPYSSLLRELQVDDERSAYKATVDDAMKKLYGEGRPVEGPDRPAVGPIDEGVLRQERVAEMHVMAEEAPKEGLRHLVNEASPEGVPAFITKSRKQELLDLGYKREEIAKMAPADAEKIVKGQTAAPKPLAPPPIPEEPLPTSPNMLLYKEPAQEAPVAPEAPVGKPEERGAVGTPGGKTKKLLGGLIHVHEDAPPIPGRAWIDTKGNVHGIEPGYMHMDWLQHHPEMLPEGVKPARGTMYTMEDLRKVEEVISKGWIRKGAPDAYQVANDKYIPDVIEHVQIYHPNLRHVLVETLDNEETKVVEIPKFQGGGVKNPFGFRSFKDEQRPITKNPVDAPRAEAEKITAEAGRNYRENLSQTTKRKFGEDEPGISFVKKSADVVKGMDESPETALGSDATNSFRQEVGTKFWKLLQLPADFLAKVPVALKEFYNPVLFAKNELIHKKLPSLVKRWKSIRAELKIDPEQDPALIDHVFGLQGDSSGHYTQTLQGADPKLHDAAVALRRRIFAVAFKDVTGVDERVAAKMREVGIEPEGKNFQTVVELLRGGDPKDAKPEHLSVALWVLDEQKRLGKNLVDLDPSYDLTGRHTEGYFTMMPVDNEIGVLQNEIRTTQAQLDAGLLSTEEHAKAMQLLERKGARLDVVKKEIEDRINRDFPKMESLPGRHFSPYFNELKKRTKDALASPEGNPLGAEFDYIKNVDTVVDRYLANAYQKRFFDIALHKAKVVLPQIADPDVRAYITTWINAVRGIRGFLEDRFIVDAVNSVKRFFGKQQSFTEDNLRNSVSEVMKFQALTKLFMSPRFAIVNATQPFMTVYPLVGGKIFGRAFAKAAAPLWESLSSGEVTPYGLFKAIYSSDAWLRARAAGVIGQSDRYLIEAEKTNVKGLEQIIAAVPSLTEDFNRVLAYHAGVDYLKTHGEASPFLKTFYIPEGKDLTSVAALHAHGRAMVEATQFMFGTEGRPLGLVGGSVRRLAGQFKTFSIAYGTLIKDGLKYGRRTGDWTPYARMMGTLWFFGGIPAVAAAASFGTSATVYDETRNWLIKNAGFAIPRSSGLSSVLDRVGLGGMSPIDVTSSIQPFNVPKQPSDVLPFLLGPTLGSGVQIFQKLKEKGLPGGIQAAAGAVSPILSGGMRAARQYAEGGVRSSSGELEMKQTTPQLISEMLGLKRPAVAERGALISDIEKAYAGGQTGLARSLEKEYRDMGGVIGPRAKASIKGRVSTENRGSLLKELGR